MMRYPAPLAATVRRLRAGQDDLMATIDEMCDRIEAVDPGLAALLPEPDRRQRLRADAATLAARNPDPNQRPVLYGALLAVKDIFHVDGFETHAGSAVPPDAIAGTPAPCVTQLHAAGVLIAGKAVTTEFAYFEPGPTRNPNNPAHTPGGSSSGSAAAVAAGLCHLALGTQTIGSVIRPAAFCGIVGFKPSLGRIDSHGLVYFSRTMDQVGLFTQDVAGMAMAAAVVCRDWRPVPEQVDRPILGIPTGPYLEQAEPAGRAAFWQQIDQLQTAGFTVRQVPALADVADLNRLHRRLVFGEFAREHATLYARYAPLYRPRTVEIIEIGRTVGEDELAQARRHTVELRHDLETRMHAAGIDLWVCPAANGPAPLGLDSTGDPAMALPWTHAGMPAITLPAGRAANGLPLGLQLVAPFGVDERLLAWAQVVRDLGRLRETV